jgi:hypothetical protein
MKIVFTRHAERKFEFHEQYGWYFKVNDIENALNNPDFIGEEFEAKFVLKKLDETHDLRVIYTEDSGIIRVITFYPTTRGRYEKS